MVLLEAETELTWVLLVALLADGLKVHLVELGPHRHLLVAGGARKVVDAPGLVEGSEYVALDHLVAHVAEIPEHLMEVRLAVGQT